MKNTKKQTATTIILLLFLLLGVIAGIIAIIYGTKIFELTKEPTGGNTNILSFSESTEFGTDYYTLMYQTSAMTANSAYASFRALKNGLGAFLIVLGIALIAIFSYKMILTISTNLVNAKNVTTTNSGNEFNKIQKELQTLKQLYEAGAITLDEYEEKKKEMLGL